MSIERHDNRSQIVCDRCPASYPNTYAGEDFSVMIADAKTSGWIIRKAKPRDDGGTAELFGAPARMAGKESRPAQPYTQTCPDCAADDRAQMKEGGLF